MLFSLILFCFIYSKVLSQPQSFLISPSDVDVLIGGTVQLSCQVSDQSSSVQWSKDGLLLGFDRSVPGFPRHVIEGEEHQGSHNLIIYNATAEDTGEYECQAGPTQEHSEITVRARVTVMEPATSIELEGHKNNSRVQVEHSQSLELKCLVKGGNPAPDIAWYRNNIKLSPDIAQSSVKDGEDGKKIGESKLRLYPLPDDNKAIYTCEAQRLHVQDPEDYQDLRVRVKLDVHFPPGRPTITGYREGDPVRGGDTLDLKCISRGGNPLSRLTWLKNDIVVDLSYISTDWESQNDFIFVADDSDSDATYTCRAESVATSETFETSISLTVLYAPSEVTIVGPTEAKPGDVLTLTCITSRSNPASEVSWVIDGRPVWSENILTKAYKGGWTTKSVVTVNITQQERYTKLFSCYAVNEALGETVLGTATVSILYAPDPPNIFGYNEQTAIRSATLQRMICVSHGGNPLPTLKWFKATEEITKVEMTTSGNILSGEITIVVAADDNGATYRCEVLNPAISEPLVASIKLKVHFPPTSVSIRVKPKRPKAGHKVSLICESRSSNPPATITWWGREAEELLPNGVNYRKVIDGGHSRSTHGGMTTKSTLIFNATAEDDGSIYTCKATNDAIQHSIHDAVVLNVMYPPVFSEADPMIADIREGESFYLNVTARSNPPNVTYQWLRQNQVLSEESYINLTAVKRADGGEYILNAFNDVGETFIRLILKVFMPAVIVKEKKEEEGPHYVLAEPESNPQLECTAEGHPLPNDTIQWKRQSFKMDERTKMFSTLTLSVDISRRVSVLTIYNVSEQDMGEFECIADNSVGDSDSYKIVLLVKHSPRIINAEDHAVVSSNRGVIAELKCQAVGAPDVTFSWSLEGVVIGTSDGRIEHSVTRIDHVTWEGKMSIKDVSVKDFGEYKCVARNDVGFDTAKVVLEANSPPDPPVAVKVMNTTDDALHISWIPGFDGGHNQTYRVRYKSKSEPAAKYVDVHPLYVTDTWLMGLKPSTSYEISVMSMNKAGQSSYSDDIVKVRTKAKSKWAIPDHPRTKLEEELQRILVTTASVLFVFLFSLNVVLLSCYYRRKRRRKRYASSGESTADVTSFSGSISTSFLTAKTSGEYTLADYSESYTKEPLSSISSHISSESHLSSSSQTNSELRSDVSRTLASSEDGTWFENTATNDIHVPSPVYRPAYKTLV